MKTSKKNEKKKLIVKYIKGMTGAIVVVFAIMLGIIGYIDFSESREPVDVTGQWEFVFSTEESTYIPYIDSETTYKVYLSQHKQEIEGSGESWEFNKEMIDYQSHIPIQFKGKIHKYNISCIYTIFGEKRTTNGDVSMEIDKNGEFMVGEFSGAGAKVEGTVKAYKVIK